MRLNLSRDQYTLPPDDVRTHSFFDRTDGLCLVKRPVWVSAEPLPGDLPPLHPDPLIHAILARRLDDPGSAGDFLNAEPRAAPNPHLLPGMPEAVERITRALKQNEAIGIFGDYDTDGITSAALLTLALRAASGGEQPSSVRLPRRREGYGLSVAGVEELAFNGVSLLIAVDCGSKDHAAVGRAREVGMDVVIVDHHRLTDAPPRDAIMASAQLCEDAPYRGMSAAGLSYLLATAIAHAGFDSGGGRGNEPTALLDLAMIGLVGDVSALLGPNRAMVRDGLRQLRLAPRIGLRALADAAAIQLEKISSTDIAFMISPRLNAPGRLDDPRAAYELLVATDLRRATQFAQETEQANQKRRMLQDRVLREIDESIAKNPDVLERRVLVFSGAGWEPGIVGLVASKLADRHDRPAVVMTLAAGQAYGSARSVPGFDITAALAASGNLLTRHGGHAQAAGLALPVTNLDELDMALQSAIAQSDIPPPGPPRIEFDAGLEPERLTAATVRLLQTLGPFGEGNPVPMLRVSRAPLREYMVMGREKQHLKLHIGEGGRAVEAILWNGAARSRELLGARSVDLAGTLEMNRWNGSERVQMRLADFRLPER